MKQEALDFCIGAERELAASSHLFAERFVALKMEFFRRFQNGVVFSTRFGAEFFTETRRCLETGKGIVPDPGIPLGEFDRAFNAWLKTQT